MLTQSYNHYFAIYWQHQCKSTYTLETFVKEKISTCKNSVNIKNFIFLRFLDAIGHEAFVG